MQTGMYDIGFEEYLADPCENPSLTASIAKEMILRSPLHAYHATPRLCGQPSGRESDAMDFGSVVHGILFGGKERIQLIDAPDWKTKAAREQRDAARAAGLIPVLPRDLDRAGKMVEAALLAIDRNTDLSGVSFDDGAGEQTFVWHEDGVDCRARLDWVSKERNLIIDLKTTAGSASPDHVAQTITRYGYDIQAAFNVRGINAVCNPALPPKFIFLFQEVEPPFACSFIGMDRWMTLGDDKCRAAMTRWRECLTSGVWPGYPQRVCYLDVPPWELDRWNNLTINGTDSAKYEGRVA